MAEADVLPYDYESYGNEITSDLKTSERSCHDAFGEQAPSFSEVEAAAARFTQAGHALAMQAPTGKKAAQLNHVLVQAERSLLQTNGLPRRPWFKHAIFPPSELKVYSAAVLPGITEAIDRHDLELTRTQIGELTNALNRAAQTYGKLSTPLIVSRFVNSANRISITTVNFSGYNASSSYRL